MTNELKPVKCGCGGEARIEAHYDINGADIWQLRCPCCGIKIGYRGTETEAIEAWNRAMGAKDINVHNKERTAKVIDKSMGRHSISDFDWTGKCEKCGNEIQYSFDFCPYCGCRLEWK